MSKVSKIFAKRLKKAVEDLNLTQEQAAKSIGIQRYLLRKYILGETVPSIDRAEEIANAFGYELWEWISLDKAKPTPQQAIEVLSSFVEKKSQK